ncbi:MAG: lysophospholipid acyltransferase family protein [Pseudarcicella sp.]|nr:lysophospholipid acyltransferase family protein [Pseudarcicella sp.]MBP6410690.1 lysophospholipid acyltransferase family protein [Pseudarcicella sp.]
MLKIISKILLKISGWRAIDTTPLGVKNYPKSVLIAAPHTSNWDFFYCMAIIHSLGLEVKYLGKASLFKFPYGWLMKAFGGIAVDRSKNNNLVESMAEMIVNHPKNICVIVPAEGTRGYTKEWKSGFYHMANIAKVPIVLGFLDYKKKEGGFLDIFHPSGDYDNDLPKIKDYYADITPKIMEYYSLKDYKKTV